MKTQLFPYQEEAVQGIERFVGRCPVYPGSRTLVAYDPGLGKSIISLTHLHRNPEIKRAVVVCPASIKYNWQHEAKVHLGMASEILSSRKPPKHRVSRLLLQARLLIINYDILAWWLDFLREYQPQLIIGDECHLLGSRSSLRTRSFRQLAKQCPHLLMLSGTPLVNRPAELWPTLNCLRPDLFPHFTPFAKAHCNPRLAPWGWTYNGATRLPLLHRTLLESCMIRKRKSEVLHQLPPEQTTIVPLDMEMPSEYHAAVKDFLGWLKKTSPHLAKRAAKAEQVTKLGYLKRLAARLKSKAALSWLDDYLAESDEKLLLFTAHTSMVNRLMDHFGKHAVKVDGSVTGKRRQVHFDLFNSDKKTRILVGNIDAAGVGWSCRSTSTVVFLELPWVPGKVVQAKDRCRGVGRGIAGQHTRSIFLVAKDTVEEDLCKLLQKKQKVLSQVLDGGELQEDLNIYDQLTATLRGEAEPLASPRPLAKRPRRR